MRLTCEWRRISRLEHCEKTDYLDSRQESGPTTTWMWFKITKPLVSMNGNAPPVLATMPESWVIFAIPKLQVETIEEA